jgi:hypothetical protein
MNQSVGVLLVYLGTAPWRIGVPFIAPMGLGAVEAPLGSFTLSLSACAPDNTWCNGYRINWCAAFFRVGTRLSGAPIRPLASWHGRCRRGPPSTLDCPMIFSRSGLVEPKRGQLAVQGTRQSGAHRIVLLCPNEPKPNFSISSWLILGGSLGLRQI